MEFCCCLIALLSDVRRRQCRQFKGKNGGRMRNGLTPSVLSSSPCPRPRSMMSRSSLTLCGPIRLPSTVPPSRRRTINWSLDQMRAVSFSGTLTATGPMKQDSATSYPDTRAPSTQWTTHPMGSFSSLHHVIQQCVSGDSVRACPNQTRNRSSTNVTDW